jgi:hypothetical protein
LCHCNVYIVGKIGELAHVLANLPGVSSNHGKQEQPQQQPPATWSIGVQPSTRYNAS